MYESCALSHYSFTFITITSPMFHFCHSLTTQPSSEWPQCPKRDGQSLGWIRKNRRIHGESSAQLLPSSVLVIRLLLFRHDHVSSSASKLTISKRDIFMSIFHSHFSFCWRCSRIDRKIFYTAFCPSYTTNFIAFIFLFFASIPLHSWLRQKKQYWIRGRLFFWWCVSLQSCLITPRITPQTGTLGSIDDCWIFRAIRWTCGRCNGF